MTRIVQHLFDSEDVKEMHVFDKLLNFFNVPGPFQSKKGITLNQTLGGYINKILSFWLMKEPEILLAYLVHPVRRSKLIDSLFNHLYMSSCVIDILVRLCTI